MTALVVATALLAAGASSAHATSRGDVSVLALIPTPGYPALPHVVGNLIYEGTYDNPAGDSVPSRVLEYTSDGTLTHSWTVQGQDLSKPHGVQVAANDAQGRLLLLDKTSGRITASIREAVPRRCTRRSRTCPRAVPRRPIRPVRRRCWSSRRCLTTPPGDRTAACTSPTTSRR